MACGEACGCAGARLVDMVVNPHALVESSSRLRLHSIYYITKQVAAHLMPGIMLLLHANRKA